MQTAYYNDGNKEDDVNFYYLTEADVQNANADCYMQYLYNVTKIQTFIKGLYIYTLYEEGWDAVDNSKVVRVEGDNAPQVEGSKRALFDFFMHQMDLSIQAEARTRDSYAWSDYSMRDKVLAGLRDIVIPDFNNWRSQQR